MENQIKELSLGFCQGIVVFFNHKFFLVNKGSGGFF